MRRIGVANVNRHAARRSARARPVAAVQVALSPFDDRALRGGVIERCDAAGHRGDRPFAARRARARRTARTRSGARSRCRGARREPGRGRARVAARPLADRGPDPRRAPPRNRAFRGGRGRARARRGRPAKALTGVRVRPRRLAASVRGPAEDAEVVLVMGIPGAGKTRVAEELRRPRIPSPQPGRSRRLAARARRSARRRARLPVRIGSCSTTPI